MGIYGKIDLQPRCGLSPMAVNRKLTRNSPPDEVLSVVNHRPYALPKRPWTMMQRWNDLLFAHWPIAAAKLEPLLPAGLQVDTFDQSGWLGVVPFWRGQPLSRTQSKDLCPGTKY
jgi:hypothetical protein